MALQAPILLLMKAGVISRPLTGFSRLLRDSWQRRKRQKERGQKVIRMFMKHSNFFTDWNMLTLGLQPISFEILLMSDTLLIISDSLALSNFLSILFPVTLSIIPAIFKTDVSFPVPTLYTPFPAA